MSERFESICINGTVNTHHFPFLYHTVYLLYTQVCIHTWHEFLGTVRKTVRPMLPDRCPVCSVLSVCLSVCLSVTFVYCGQTVAWIKMKLGTKVGLGPGHIVLDRDPAPPQT